MKAHKPSFWSTQCPCIHSIGIFEVVFGMKDLHFKPCDPTMHTEKCRKNNFNLMMQLYIV